jgi:hypothetical protein
MKHLNPRQLAALAAGRLPPDQWRAAVRHLLSGCARCTTRLIGRVPEKLRREPEPPAGGREREAYDAAFERAQAKLAEQEARWRKDQERLALGLSLLRENPQGYTGFSFHQVKSLRGWPLVEALLQRSYELRFTDREEMKWLAYNAVFAADNLRSEGYGISFVSDLRARAWAELGNACRLTLEFAAAEHAFVKARELLREGTGDLLLLARVAELEASFRTDEDKLTESGGLLSKVNQLYLGLGERHLAGRARLSESRTWTNKGETQRALALVQEGLQLLDREVEPLVSAVGQHHRLDILVDGGDPCLASKLLLRSGLRQAFAAEPIMLTRLRWLEGKLFFGLGDMSRAARVLSEAQAEFLGRGLSYLAAAVGLDLAPALLRQGRIGQVRQLAGDILEILRQHGTRTEADRALQYLRAT